MQHVYEALVFIAYAFLAPVITAGGSTITTNALHLVTDIDLIKATGLTSAFFLLNCLISLYVFRSDVVWKDARRLLIPCIVGGFIGALFLVRVSPLILLSLMFVFSLYFMYKKLISHTAKVVPDSWVREVSIGTFSGAVIGAALPGGGFLNAYFASRGFTLTQMFGTISFIMPIVFLVKLLVMIQSKIVSFGDLWGVLYAFPFLIIANILIRKGMLKLSKGLTDKITILAMCILSGYLLFQIVTYL